MTSEINIENHAVRGRSIRGFISEERWEFHRTLRSRIFVPFIEVEFFKKDEKDLIKC